MASEVSFIRKTMKNQSMLLLDCGDILGENEAKEPERIDVIFNTMDRLGYQAMSLGKYELALGTEKLTDIRSKISFPMIASNLIGRKGDLSFAERYVIKKFGNITVGFLGVVPVGLFDIASPNTHFDEFHILDPAIELKKLIPEIKTKVDFLILLSQCGYGETEKLIKDIDGIDLAITNQTTQILPDGENRLVQAALRAKQLGYLQLFFDKNNKFEYSLKRSIKIDNSVKSDEDVENLLEEAKAKKEERERLAFRNQINELHKLTPMEYYQKILKDQQAKEAKSDKAATEKHGSHDGHGNHKEGEHEWKKPKPENCD